MAITINFDSNYNVEQPTFVLGKRSGDKIGVLENVTNINLKDSMTETPEISFTVHKHNNGIKCTYWDEIKDFRLVWCKEWDMWFELTIDTNISNETIKNIALVRLAEAELSQTNLYGIEINTELDISRDDYTEPTILYNAENHKASLLHRILEKVPHYSLKHVDISIANIQRTFEFDGTALTDALQEIATELNALVVYHSSTDEDGKIERKISMYDLESNCLDCGHRGEFTSTCPECGSENITEGYGEDTTICIDDENSLGSDITLEVDTDSVKNCFKLVTGDDLLTATVVNCNPNGTEYLWYFSEDTKEEMSDELRNKINEYDILFNNYRNEYQAEISSDVLIEYTNLINDYNNRFNQNLENISSPIVGYSNLMNAHYNTIDMLLYLQSGLMPSFEMEDTNAEKQIALLTTTNLSPIAVNNINTVSVTTANSAVLAMAKLIVNPQYKVSIESSTYDSTTKIWSGVFKVENKDTDEVSETDFAISNTVNITINGDYETFVKQKLSKLLGDYYEQFNTDISFLFDKNETEFKEEIKQYSLNGLTSLHDACQSCVDVMIEQGISTNKTDDLYINLYAPYYKRLKWLEEEILIRENEIAIVANLQVEIEEVRNTIQENLNFEEYLGEDLWFEFCSFRREDTYENSNYISDGLDNAELFKKALEFIEVAEKEIYKSATMQHKITANVKNLLVIKEFKPLVEYFSCGNWLRVKIDNVLYKLRLLDYSINYDDLSDIDVTFSDVLNTSDGISDARSILEKASSMATSYDSIKRQASQGSDSYNTLDNWVQKGLNATTVCIVNSAENQTQTWDNHGMLYRQYDDITETYLPEQLKIINSGLYITDNNWETSRAGIGRFIYLDPESSEYKEAYGIVADTICSNLILSENVGIYNRDNSVIINQNGIAINKDGTTNVTITPDGKLTCTGAVINGEINAEIGEIGGFTIADKYLYNNSYTSIIGIACDINRYAFWAGETNGALGLISSSNASFRVTRDGELYAKDAQFYALHLDTNIYFYGNKNTSIASISSGYASSSSTDVTVTVSCGTSTNLGSLLLKSNDYLGIDSNRVYISAKKPTTGTVPPETPNVSIVSDDIDIYSSNNSSSSTSISLTSYTVNVTSTNSTISSTNTNIYGTTVLYLSTNDTMSVKANAIRLSCNNVAPSSASENVIRFNNDGSHAYFRPTTDGITWLGSTNFKWYAVYATNGVKTSSDRRNKYDINYEVEQEMKELIYNLKPVSFKSRYDVVGIKNYGLIAQDVRDFLIKENKEQFAGLEVAKNEGVEDIEVDLNTDESKVNYCMQYDQFITPLIAVVQSQKKEIDELKQLVDNLNSLVNTLIEGRV